MQSLPGNGLAGSACPSTAPAGSPRDRPSLAGCTSVTQPRGAGCEAPWSTACQGGLVPSHIISLLSRWPNPGERPHWDGDRGRAASCWRGFQQACSPWSMCEGGTQRWGEGQSPSLWPQAIAHLP